MHWPTILGVDALSLRRSAVSVGVLKKGPLNEHTYLPGWPAWKEDAC
jgi:hypothetical protein